MAIKQLQDNYRPQSAFRLCTASTSVVMLPMLTALYILLNFFIALFKKLLKLRLFLFRLSVILACIYKPLMIVTSALAHTVHVQHTFAPHDACSHFSCSLLFSK